MTPSEVFEQIEQKELVPAHVPSGEYYLSRQGDLYSLNRAVPKKIVPNPMSDGEVFVTLYTPSLSVYSMAELMLNTFSSKAPDGKIACYKNGDPGDLSLANLFWGDREDKLKWKANRTIVRSKTITKENYNNIQQSTALYCNKAFLKDINLLITQTLRVALNQSIDNDKTLILMSLNKLTEITSVTLLKFDEVITVLETEFENAQINSLFKTTLENIRRNRQAYENL